MKNSAFKILLASLLLFTQGAQAAPSSGAQDLRVNSSIALKELSSTPSAPPTGYSKTYFKNDGNLYRQNSAGTETAFAAGSVIAPTVQKFLSGSGTYTRPTSPTPLYLVVKVLGAGEGGTPQGGNPGGNTTFGSSVLTANGGGSSSTGIGGTFSVSGGAIDLGSFNGGDAHGGAGGQSGVGLNEGPPGCASPLGGAGGGGKFGTAGGNAVANTGSGGGGGGETSAGFNSGTAAGSCGAFVSAIIASPSGTYAYSIGSGGAGGASTGQYAAGGNGGSGGIWVIEYYQ